MHWGQIFWRNAQKKGRPTAALLECFVCERLLELSTLWKTIAKLSAGYTLLFTAHFPVGLTRAQRTAVVKLLHDTGRLTVGAGVAADTRRVGAGSVRT